mmetsp:Transcript_8859/g.20827  ORF Transcript_8859/g.20827 Transcript_8859/m.20827 type:complete len:250 (+) Transcript_8859:100-849(+)|eukprot:CAMPEP_0171101304 /NCGR_PEP_ID=MMETSP0766_2-20121228/54589_1 /TAXON_ID=439317 /ORGANISM="Gambierdiscus australes, Strain CAWD 149" /LENGTH=249 /DNA_ID=CAMNT_0011561327 /DNA_START=99 /DNA_END=848 /DNA_ORIENTATION=+
MAGFNCCELSNVFAAMLAFIMSQAGLGLCLHSRRVALGGLPDAAQPYLDALSFDCACVVASAVLLNFGSVTVLCLSTFECNCLKNSKLMHCLTQATSLCCWCFLTWCTFLLQLVMSTFAMVWFVMMDFLVFLCSSDQPTLQQAQNLLYDFGNLTDVEHPGLVFHPYGVKDVRDTPIVSLKALAKHLDLLQFCSSEHGGLLDNGSAYFWMGCLLTVVSQALMAIALNGEKERVSVHELHEREGFLGRLFS